VSLRRPASIFAIAVNSHLNAFASVRVPVGPRPMLGHDGVMPRRVPFSRQIERLLAGAKQAQLSEADQLGLADFASALAWLEDANSRRLARAPEPVTWGRTDHLYRALALLAVALGANELKLVLHRSVYGVDLCVRIWRDGDLVTSDVAVGEAAGMTEPNSLRPLRGIRFASALDPRAAPVGDLQVYGRQGDPGEWEAKWVVGSHAVRNIALAVHSQSVYERMSRLEGRLLRLTAENRSLTFGTRLSEGVGALTSAFRFDLTGFVGTSLGTAQLRYLTKQRKPTARGRYVGDESSIVALSESLRAAVCSGAPFYWDDARTFEAIFARGGNGVGADHRGARLAKRDPVKLDLEKKRAVVFPLLRFGQVVGMYVGLEAREAPGLDPHQLNVVHDALQVLSQDALYEAQRSFGTVILNPVFAARDTRVTPGRVAVLMPFTEAWSDRIWRRIMSPVLEDLGLSGLRADDLYGHDVMEDIWSMLLSSEVVVADISGRNPNVFYELGIAHTLGKRVILATQDVDDIPFDLNRYRHIIYSDDLDGYESLRRGLIQTFASLGIVTPASRDH
jgi:hypothetical protein